MIQMKQIKMGVMRFVLCEIPNFKNAYELLNLRSILDESCQYYGC